MKAEINANGVLTIIAETGLEAFALREWGKVASGPGEGLVDGSMIVTDYSLGRPVAKQIADPCPGCLPGSVCRTPTCGRLRLKGGA